MLHCICPLSGVKRTSGPSWSFVTRAALLRLLGTLEKIGADSAHLVADARDVGAFGRLRELSRHRRQIGDFGEVAVSGRCEHFPAEMLTGSVDQGAYVRADKCFVRGEFSVTAVEAKNEQVPIAEGGVVVVEAVDGGGFVSLHRSDCTGQHRLRLLRRAVFGLRFDDGASESRGGQGRAEQQMFEHGFLH